MTRRTVLLSILIPALCVTTLAQPSAPDRGAMNRPFGAFHVIGNIYFVGAAGVSAFLINTPEGSILLDGGLPETVPQIRSNMSALGFQLRDVKYLLNSHAHFDHAGGLAELKKLTSASLIASAGDAPALTAGGPDMPAVVVDRIIGDRDTVRLDNTVLTAHVTPGHTKGCTTWTMMTREGGKTHNVVFYCSTSVVDRLIGNTGYPQIVADYERTFEALRKIPSDVFLANHPGFFNMADKRTRMMKGGPSPFIDSSEMARFVDDSERQFRTALANQRSLK